MRNWYLTCAVAEDVCIESSQYRVRFQLPISMQIFIIVQRLEEKSSPAHRDLTNLVQRKSLAAAYELKSTNEHDERASSVGIYARRVMPGYTQCKCALRYSVQRSPELCIRI